jgi:hypothetical protein
MVKEISILYDSNGNPVFRILENNKIVDFEGRRIGFIKGDDVYDYNGSHRGFYEAGILRDHWGNTVAFGDRVSSGSHPLFPLRKCPKFSRVVDLEPLLPLAELPPWKPLKTMKWSDLDPMQLFNL